MWRAGNILLLTLTLTATTVRAATFEFFKDPLPSTWASFAFDADGDKLACNYGGHLFLWSPAGGFQDLGDGHPQSGSIGISANGTTICATRVNPVDGYLNPALWSENQGWIDLGHTIEGCVEDESWGSGFDLTDDGTEAVGLAWTCQGAQAFHWKSNQGMIGLANQPWGSTSRATAIAGNGSLLAGFMEHPQNGYRQPVYWVPHKNYQRSLYAGPEARGEALAVNTLGTMVVGYHVFDQVEHAHYWTPSTGLVELGNLSQSPWDASRATHVTEDGTVIGTSTHSTWNITEAFFWDAFDGMIRLQDLLLEQGAVVPDNIWIDEVMAVSDDATRLLGSWRNAQGDQGYCLARIDIHQKASINECLASIDGSRLELDFKLSSNDPSRRPTLIANRDGQKWEVPLQFQDRSCRGIDHQANLGQSGEVVYELVLENADNMEVLEHFSIWTENSQNQENPLAGSLVPRSPNNFTLHIRLQRPGNLVITNQDESGQTLSPLSCRIFESGYHQISWKAPTSGVTDPQPGQYIHIEWK